ncbi:MAG: hypothetical protein AMXMBFR4_04590 [Candidatus Hydrogenedentota bacterium]
MTIRSMMAVAAVSFMAAPLYAQPYADMALDPPAVKTSAGPIAESTLGTYLTNVEKLLVFDLFQGRNGLLKSQADQSKLRIVADGFYTYATSAELFGAARADGPHFVYSASIASLDAYATRLLVDLSQLSEGEEVFVVDSTGPRAFGPYTQSDHVEGGRWLPTTSGDNCVILARSPHDTPPNLTVIGVSHFFEPFEDVLKELSCNNPIACEGDSALQTTSTGVGMLVIPQGQLYQALCSGSLLNNSDTPAFEPYYLTSWHCVPDAANANQVDVIWDWRASSCQNGNLPAIVNLPRSSGKQVLRTNSNLDLTLMELNSVPSGNLGRAYLGWETRDPIVNEDIVSIHFPQGSAMKISYGTVQSINQSSAGFTKQTKVHWDDGVTEGGSSGSPLLLADSAYRVCGTLSNGPVHSCANTAGNVDWYSSFRDFFPQIEGWLTGTNPPDPDPGLPPLCPAAKVLQDDPEMLENLRAFRDAGLKRIGFGAHAVELYYAIAPYLTPVADYSESTRRAFRVAASPFAWMGGMLRS